MGRCGIARIDNLNAAVSGTVPIGSGDSDQAAVGVIHDLLTGQGQKGLPNLFSSDYGVFGSRTTLALHNFRVQQGLAGPDQIDIQTLQRIVQVQASAPIASRAYLTLVLNFSYSGLVKILSVVAQMEGAGKFGALNLNIDKAGLSFGLIQWAQKPGRLAEILSAFFATMPQDFVQILGGGNPTVANGLLAHAHKPNGGINPTHGGWTTDPAFDLVEEPWVSRFGEVAVSRGFQGIQVRTAIKDFASSFARLKEFAPELTSERSVAFVIDLANQFGDGGARNIHKAVFQNGMSQADLLAAMAQESVDRIQDPFKAGTQARRQHFLTTGFLSDAVFDNKGSGLFPAA